MKTPQEAGEESKKIQLMSKTKKLSKKKKIIIAIALAAITAAAIFLVVVQKNNGATVTYTESKATIQDITSYYSYDGYIEAGTSQTVYASNVCTVKDVCVSPGDTVQKGDLLVAYDSDSNSSLIQAKASLSSAKLSLNTAKTNASRISSLYQMGAVSAEENEQAQNSLASAQIQLTQAQASYQSALDQQDDSQVTAKISGQVISVNVKDGDDLTSGTEVMEIISYDDLEINITIDEYDIAALSVGQEAEVTVSSTGETVKGTVSELSRKATVTNGVSYFSGTVKLEATDTVTVGTSVEIKITTSDVKNVLTVPTGAIQYDENSQAYVLKKDGSGQVQQAVEIGSNNGVLVEIKSGLEEGDTVMIPSIQNESNSSSNTAINIQGIGGMPAGGGQPPSDAGRNGQTSSSSGGTGN